MGGYTPIVNGRGLVETTGTVGPALGANKRFGALIGVLMTGMAGIDDLEPVPDIAAFPGGTDRAILRGHRHPGISLYRSRWGLAGSADYKASRRLKFYIRGLYSDFRTTAIAGSTSFTDNTPILNPPHYPMAMHSRAQPLPDRHDDRPSRAVLACPLLTRRSAVPIMPSGVPCSVGKARALHLLGMPGPLRGAFRQIGQIGDRTASFTPTVWHRVPASMTWPTRKRPLSPPMDS